HAGRIGDERRVGLLAGRDFGDHADVALLLEQPQVAAAHHRMVIGAQHVDHPAPLACPPTGAAATGSGMRSTRRTPAPGALSTCNPPPSAAARSPAPSR